MYVDHEASLIASHFTRCLSSTFFALIRTGGSIVTVFTCAGSCLARRLSRNFSFAAFFASVFALLFLSSNHRTAGSTVTWIFWLLMTFGAVFILNRNESVDALPVIPLSVPGITASSLLHVVALLLIAGETQFVEINPASLAFLP